MITKLTAIYVLLSLLILHSISQAPALADDGTCVTARHGMVVSDHRLASQAGGDVLKKGGNARGDFNPIPGHTDASGLIGTPPNLISPQKRMLSSMTPTILAKDGKPVMVVGTPGGRTIINTVLQVILNVIDHRTNIADAIEAGRFHHQWLPDVTSIEKRAVTADLQKLYQGLGHKVGLVDAQGRAMGVFISHDRGILTGAADSRSPDGAAVGY